MSRRTLTPRSGRVGRAASRMAPGGRVIPEAPITRIKERTGGMGSVETIPPTSCSECWDVPGLPADRVDIYGTDFFTNCMPEFHNYYGNDSEYGVGSGHNWSATMSYGVHVSATIAESPSSVVIQFFVGDTTGQFILHVLSPDWLVSYTMTSFTICPVGVTPPWPIGGTGIAPTYANLQKIGTSGNYTLPSLTGYTSAVLYVATYEVSGIIIPAGWQTIHSGTQTGTDGAITVTYHMLKIDNITGSEGTLFKWAAGNSGRAIEFVYARFGGGSGGSWGHIVGPSYSFAQTATWTGVGGAVRHVQVMHCGSHWWPDAVWGGQSFISAIGPYPNHSYDAAALATWQANPKSGNETWSTIGGAGMPFSSSFAFVWSP